MLHKFRQKIFNIIDIKFIKFLFVGVLNSLFGYGSYSLLLFLNFHFALASIIATILGILFNFKTIGIIVFKNHDNSMIFRFLCVYAITYLINVFFLSIFDYLNFNMYFAGFIILLPIAFLSFILMKGFVFSQNKYQREKEYEKD